MDESDRKPIKKKDSEESNRPKTAESRPQTASGDPAEELGAVPLTADEKIEKRDRQKWLKLSEVFKVIETSCHWLYSLIQGKNSVNLDISIKSVSDLIEKLSYISPFVRKTFSPKIGSEPGYVRIMFQKWARGFYDDFAKMHTNLKAYLEDLVHQEEQARRKWLMMSRQQQEREANEKQKSQIMAQLAGLTGGAEDEGMEDLLTVNISPADRLKKQEQQQDLTGYLALELFQRCCLGLHYVEIVTAGPDGGTRLSMGCQGLDIVELLPRIPPLMEVKQWSDQMRKKFKNRESGK